MVAGDTGGARTMLAIREELTKRGWKVYTFFDPEGEGQYAAKEALANMVGADMERAVNDSDLLYIATCSTAYKAAHRALKGVVISDRIVFSPDGYFNHYFPQWRKIQYGHWLAVDDYHAPAIAEMRPGLPKGNIHVTGLPAFDDLPDVYARRDEIRRATRASLGLSPAYKVVLWWSHGTREVAAEDVEMILHGLTQIAGALYPCVFVPRLHPKLDKEVSPGYVKATRTLVERVAGTSGIKCIDADKVSPTELDLAADVVVTATSSEATKCVMLGGPPVVHILGPRNQDWLAGLGAQPLYIPYLSDNRALVAWSVTEVGEHIIQALSQDAASQLRHGWIPPKGGAAERTADVLESLVD